MKYIIAFISVIILLGVVLGCSRLNPFADRRTAPPTNKTYTDKAVDTAVGEEKIGIPECDEVMDMITEIANNPDDGFVSKAIKATFINRIKTALRNAIEESKNKKEKDNVDLARECRDFKKQLEKYKAEEAAKESK